MILMYKSQQTILSPHIHISPGTFCFMELLNTDNRFTSIYWIFKNNYLREMIMVRIFKIMETSIFLGWRKRFIKS